MEDPGGSTAGKREKQLEFRMIMIRNIIAKSE